MFNSTVYNYVQCIGLLTILRYPYPRVVSEPSYYEVIRVQAQMGPPLPIEANNDNTLIVSLIIDNIIILFIIQNYNYYSYY